MIVDLHLLTWGKEDHRWKFPEAIGDAPPLLESELKNVDLHFWTDLAY